MSVATFEQRLARRSLTGGALPEWPGPRLIDWRMLSGPVGRLAVAGVLAAMVSVTFIAAVPLWLVTEKGVATDAALIGWTLAVYSLAAAAGRASARLRPAVLVPVTIGRRVSWRS